MLPDQRSATPPIPHDIAGHVSWLADIALRIAEDVEHAAPYFINRGWDPAEIRSHLRAQTEGRCTDLRTNVERGLTLALGPEAIRPGVPNEDTCDVAVQCGRCGAEVHVEQCWTGAEVLARIDHAAGCPYKAAS